MLDMHQPRRARRPTTEAANGNTSTPLLGRGPAEWTTSVWLTLWHGSARGLTWEWVHWSRWDGRHRWRFRPGWWCGPAGSHCRPGPATHSARSASASAPGVPGRSHHTVIVGRGQPTAEQPAQRLHMHPVQPWLYSLHSTFGEHIRRTRKSGVSMPTTKLSRPVPGVLARGQSQLHPWQRYVPAQSLSSVLTAPDALGENGLGAARTEANRLPVRITVSSFAPTRAPSHCYPEAKRQPLAQ